MKNNIIKTKILQEKRLNKNQPRLKPEELKKLEVELESANARLIDITQTCNTITYALYAANAYPDQQKEVASRKIY